MNPNTPAATAAQANRLAVLFGGEEITVRTMADVTLKVKVAVVPVRYLGTFVDLYDKPAELADFICHVDGKPVPPNWADQLTDISIEEIREKARDLNFHRAVKWSEDQIAAGKEMAIPIVRRLTGLLSFVQTQLASSVAVANKSSTSPSPGSVSS